ELTGNNREEVIASFFWSTMVTHHTYANGGNSNYEYCGAEDKLNDRLSDNTSETCNTYNMLKLTRHLFGLQPEGKLNDYYERALYNHILASQNPGNGMMCYFVPLRMGARKQFSDEFNTFTCCVGTGMENHSKYAENIYSEGADSSLYLNLFIGSRLNWKTKKVKIDQETSFPETSSSLITISVTSPATFTLRVRHPAWANTVTLEINGKKITADESHGYLSINRTWKNGDRLKISLPMKLRTEPMPDNTDRLAILYGPLLMAGDLGTKMPDPVYGAPVLLTSTRNVADWVKPAGGPLDFRLLKVGKPEDVNLVPFYKIVDQYYSVYWDLFSQEAWSKRQLAYEEDKRKKLALEQRTIDELRLGEMQPERDHKLEATDQSYTEIALGRGGREVRNGGYFSFTMKVLPDEGNVLQLSYLGDDRDRTFEILADGTTIATGEMKGGPAGQFIDVEYPIPAGLTKGKSTIRITIQARPGKTAGRIFSPRILRVNNKH
ncbi:MAG: glycoside hydrolase family 127 protein, partial [Chitinophagaceae bacterium]